MLKPDEVNYVIYHYPCIDGFGSALIVWKYFKEKFPDKLPIFKPMNYGTIIPKEINNLSNILMVDFSFKKEVIKQLLEISNKLLIIDHHKSSCKELEDLDNKYKIFVMNHSGVGLTWKYFYPNKELPRFLSLI